MNPLIANRFELHDLLGRGGMGEVYRAVDTQTGETVAVKALNPEVLERDPTLLERFVREGEALRQLNHPNIVHIIAAVEEEEKHYLVMEFVEGGSLRELLNSRGCLPANEVVKIALEVADALTRAHHLKIIHRDLKPANILLAKDGTPRLADFGIAHIQDNSQLTQTGMLVGTVDYLSPEVCQGETPIELSDIWAFGVLLFEMLSGFLPFEGKNLTAKITAILHQPVPDLIQLAPNAPDALVDLIYRMLEKDSRQRIPSVRLVGAELEAMLKGREPITPSHPVSIKSRFETSASPTQEAKHNFPTGTVTFLFTDIEGSTKLAREHPETWESLRARHDAILRAAIESNSGFVFQVVGDSFYAAFHKTGDALKAALQAQYALNQTFEVSETSKVLAIRVRMGIHTGEAETDGKEYCGYLTLSLAQRVMSTGHGGQILLSNAAENLLRDQLPEDVTLRDMGEYKLKDALLPVRIFQVIAPALQIDFPALRALNVFHHNLPVQITSFIGREKEINEISEALVDHRLVTLTGSGGMGKTRLALEAGAAQLSNYPNGVYFVPLAPLDSIDAIIPTIAQALGFSFYEGGEPRQQLLDYLREKSMLLIMDNFENLLNGAGLVSEILNTAPQVKILSTSRARLNVQGEQLFRLGGMDFPDWETPANAMEYSAVKLFMQSACRVRPDFGLAPDNLKYVARICKLVEGIPLGILLAASWVEMLSPEEIAKEIEKNLDFLETEQRDLPDRQHSMRAVFDYSWNLLTEREQKVFQGLSVFRGGFTRKAAQQVTGASLRDLMGLVDKSLLQPAPTGRYNMHELLRQYAHDKLLESGESGQVQTRHLDFFLQLAEEAEPKLRGPEQHDWLERLDNEHDNLRAALEWSLNEGCVDKGMQLAYALLWFWDMRAYWGEGLETTKKLLMHPEASPKTLLRANALLTAAALSGNLLARESQQQYYAESVNISREQGDAGKWTLAMGLGLAGFEIFGGDLVTAGSMVEEGLTIARSLGDKWLIAFTLAHAGYFSVAKLDHAAAQKMLEKSLELFRSLGDMRWSAIVSSAIAHEDIRQGDFAGARLRFQEALPILREERDKDTIRWALNALGVMAHAEGNYDLAKGYYVEALEFARDLGSGVLAPAWNLGCILLYEGDLASAKVLFVECMGLARQDGSKATVAYAIQGYAALAAVQKQARKAIMLLAATRKLQEDAVNKSIISPSGEADFARNLAIAREQLDDAAFNAAWAEGQKMTTEQVIELAMQEEAK